MLIEGLQARKLIVLWVDGSTLMLPWRLSVVESVVGEW